MTSSEKFRVSCPDFNLKNYFVRQSLILLAQAGPASSCFSFQSAKITVVCHHTWLCSSKFNCASGPLCRVFEEALFPTPRSKCWRQRETGRDIQLIEVTKGPCLIFDMEILLLKAGQRQKFGL